MPAGHKTHQPATMSSKSAHHASVSSAKINNHHDPVIKNTGTPSAKLASPTFLPPSSIVSASIPSFSVSQTIAPTPTSLGTPNEQSSTPLPVPPSSSSTSASIIGGVLGGIILCLTIVIYALYRRIKKKKEHRRHKDILTNCTDPSRNGGWNVTRSWSTLDTNDSKFAAATDMNSPPPAYYCSTRTNKKRWTQDSVISKQSSFVKQYSPQLAYSPSQSTILQMDHEGVSPSHTLVDTSGLSWLHQKDNLSLPEYEDDQQQQRRSIQPYQAQLDISSSFSDALDPPGSYHSGILLHTNPSSTS